MNERIVRRLWVGGGTWPDGLPRTDDGVPLRVIFPGRPGHGVGPDLLDAVLALPDGRLLHGDIELHVRSSDWQVHGHDRDERYRRVVLHVVWSKDKGGPPGVPTVELSRLPEPLVFDRLSAPYRVDEPYHRWIAGLSSAGLANLVEELGDERLEARSLRISADLHALGPAQALHRALCDALGFAHNRAAFVSLSDLIPAAELLSLAWVDRDEAGALEAVTAHLFARAGLLDEGPMARITDQQGLGLFARYREIVATPSENRLAPGAWETVGVRPANRPGRRLAALAALTVRARAEGLDGAIVSEFGAAEPRIVLRRLSGLLRVGPGRDYWSFHFDLGRHLPGAPLAPLGDSRTGVILANVVLPFALALADATDQKHLAATARAVWRIAPGSGPNWITTEMRPLLAGLPLVGARREQGAIELYRRCCEERRCDTCPAASVQARLAR